MEFWSRYMKLKKSRKADGISRLSTRVDFRKKNWTKTPHKQHGQKLNSYVMRQNIYCTVS